MSDAPGSDSGLPDPAKLTPSQIKLRRGTRFFFESGAPKPAEPLPVDDPPSPSANVPAGALPPIDDAAPTKLIKPANQKTPKIPADSQAGDEDEARPTVLKGSNVERLPGRPISGVIKRVEPAPVSAAENAAKTQDMDLISDHLKKRPGSGAREVDPDGGPTATSGTPAAAKPGSGLRGTMGTVPSSGKRKAAPGSGIHGTAAGGLLANLPTTQQFPPAAPGDRGTWFGGFHLIQELTIGGFGEVWIALDTATNKEVVIKRLKPEQAEFKRAFYQFDIEIEIGQRVKHPNLVPVLQHGIVDGRRFFTMPRITGPSLTRILNKRAGEEWTLSILEILAALEMIGRALGFLHRAGVVHCDLKPDNILFSARNRPMLIDLGIARTVNWAQSGYRALKAFREDDSILGTPEYMAPELFLGENEQIGFGVDLYAMGVILYEVLAGVTPFKRDSQQAGGDATKVLVELMDRVQTAAPPEVLELNPTAPPALAELAMQCLSKDPAGRPKSADDFAVAIGRVLRPVKTPTPKGKQGALTRLTKLIRKSDKPKS